MSKVKYIIGTYNITTDTLYVGPMGNNSPREYAQKFKDNPYSVIHDDDKSLIPVAGIEGLTWRYDLQGDLVELRIENFYSVWNFDKNKLAKELCSHFTLTEESALAFIQMYCNAQKGNLH